MQTLPGKRPDPTGELLAFLTDFDAYPFVNDVSLYRTIMECVPKIADGMGYSTHVVDVQQGIFAAIDLAAGAGHMPTVPVPADYQQNASAYLVDYTRDEAIQTYGAMVAHALWLEIYDKGAMRLLDLDVASIAKIIYPTYRFNKHIFESSWDIDGPIPAQQWCICDHDPKSAYDAFVSYYGDTPPADAHHAFRALYDYIGTYGHGQWNIIEHVVDKEVTRLTGGCSTGSNLAMVIAKAMNVPAEGWQGNWVDNSHSNFVFYDSVSTGFVARHGDDPYTTTYNGMPGLRMGEPYDVYKTLVLDETDQDTKNANVRSLEGSCQVSWHTSYMNTSVLYDQADRLRVQGWGYFNAGGGGLQTYASLTPDKKVASFGQFVADTGNRCIPEKPTVDNSGTEGALTPSGPLVINQEWVNANGTLVENLDITGGIRFEDDGGGSVNAVIISNCKITNPGGVALELAIRPTCYILGCEITDCDTGMLGLQTYIFRSHIHGCTQKAIDITIPSGASRLQNVFCGNLIEHSGPLSAVTIGTGYTYDTSFTANTIVQSSSAPAVYFNGVLGGYTQFELNWIDGTGNYLFLQSQTGDPLRDIYIGENKFGRSASVGLYGQTAGQTPTWVYNIYEDDGSPASIGDTAPL